MNKEFIPYGLALDLKQLRFDEPCFGYWYTEQEEFKKIDIQLSSIGFLEGEPDYILAPTYSQAFRWFREKHGLQNIIWSGKISTVFYGYNILNIEEQEFIVNNSKNGGGECDYDTYEKAELECLKRLIELVKEKQNGRGS